MSKAQAETILITGGTARIGRATVLKSERHRCNVADWKAIEAVADNQIERQFAPIANWINKL